MGKLTETLGLFADALITSYKQSEPRIKIYVGVGGLIAAGIWACASTLKARDILEESHEKIEKLENEKKTVESVITEENSEVVENKVAEINDDILKTKAKTAGKLALNYAGPVALAVVSGTTIVSGEREYNLRNMLGVAAIRKLEDKYDTLLNRITNKYGEKAKDELLYDIKPVKKEETVEDPETGKKKKRNVVKNEAGDDASPGFKLVLNKHNWKMWRNDFDSNMAQLKLTQAELNKELYNMVTFNGGNCAVKTAYDILRTIEWQGIEDTDIKRHIKDMGVVWTKEHPVEIDLGLSQAQSLKDFNVVDEDDICLHINFVENVWAYR